MNPDAIVGTCAGCEGPIVSGQGVRVAGDGGRWHPACREQALAAPAGEPKRGPGRPRKVPAA